MPACGQLLRHLTTGFGQPCGVRWTPPGCPHHPTHDGGCVSPASNQYSQSKEDDRSYSGSLTPSRQRSHHRPKQVGHSRASKWFWHELRANSSRRAISRVVLRLDRIELVCPIGRLHEIRTRTIKVGHTGLSKPPQLLENLPVLHEMLDDIVEDWHRVITPWEEAIASS